MATVSERAKLLRGEIGQQLSTLVGAIVRRNVSEQEQLEAAVLSVIEQALLAERRLAMETAIKEICLPDAGKVHDCAYPIDFSNGYHAGIQHALRQVRAAAEKEVGK